MGCCHLESVGTLAQGRYPRTRLWAKRRSSQRYWHHCETRFTRPSDWQLISCTEPCKKMTTSPGPVSNSFNTMKEDIWVIFPWKKNHLDTLTNRAMVTKVVISQFLTLPSFSITEKIWNMNHVITMVCTFVLAWIKNIPLHIRVSRLPKTLFFLICEY